MSKYTTEVRFICESFSHEESLGYDSIDDIVGIAREHIFDFYYPIFDEDYRAPLEKKILKHFYTREICEETYGLWKLRLDDRMNMLMPYVNKLYESALLEFNPFHDVDLTRKLDIENNGDNTYNSQSEGERNETGQHANTGTLASETGETTSATTNSSTDTDSSTTTNANGNTWDLYSDTPQGGIRGIQGAENDPALGTDAYLTNARHIIDGSTPTTTTDSDTTGTSTTNGTASGTRDDTSTDNGTYSNDVTDSRTGTKHDLLNSVEDYLERVTGKTAGVSYSRLLNEYRETFLNIDKILIDSLEDLFFGLWE